MTSYSQVGDPTPSIKEKTFKKVSCRAFLFACFHNLLPKNSDFKSKLIIFYLQSMKVKLRNLRMFLVLLHHQTKNCFEQTKILDKVLHIFFPLLFQHFN
jgi:hypothetical protein